MTPMCVGGAVINSCPTELIQSIGIEDFVHYSVIRWPVVKNNGRNPQGTLLGEFFCRDTEGGKLNNVRTWKKYYFLNWNHINTAHCEESMQFGDLNHD